MALSSSGSGHSVLSRATWVRIPPGLPIYQVGGTTMAYLVMLSSLIPFAKQEANKAVELLPGVLHKEFMKIGYLYCTEKVSTSIYREACLFNRYFKHLKIGEIDIPDIHDDLNNYDVLIIPGGNTFEMLEYLKNTGVFRSVATFARNKDKALIGISAGSIIMTPNIRIAQFADDNYNDYNNLGGLELVNFEVKPHWQIWKYKKQIFRDYFLLYGRSIYGVPDGEAITVVCNIPSCTPGVVKIA